MDRQEEQLTLWSEMYPYFKMKQPVILLEMFAGIGAQRKALEILGVKVDEKQSKICEWAYNSYCGYNAIHIKDKIDYSQGKTKEELIARINGTSINYNEPLDLTQLNKKSLEWLRNAYNNCEATHNLINIMNVKGADLGELPSDQTSIMTYSFPCQDLSLAGKRAGMSTSQADGGTRSGLLWEVERILLERKQQKLNMPTILIMENVPEVVGKGNIGHFKKWEQQLRFFGYSNYVEILNAKDYGIPQSRRRCFMISIYGEYAYDFPCKIRLKHKLKDLLENEVNEKYFLTDAFLNYASGSNYDNEKFNRSKMFATKLKKTNIDGIAGTITTREGGRSNDTFVIENLKTQLCNDLVKSGQVQEGDIVKHSYTTQIMSGNKKAVEKQGEMITLTTRGDCFGVVVDDKIQKVGNYGNGHHAKDVFSENGVSPTITTGNHGLGQAIQQKNLRIRKLTPLECMRLMGFTPFDTKSLYSIGLSDAAIYHVAGDSIVTTVLASIFSQLVNDKISHISIVENYVEKEIIENGN